MFGYGWPPWCNFVYRIKTKMMGHHRSERETLLLGICLLFTKRAYFIFFTHKLEGGGIAKYIGNPTLLKNSNF